MKLNQKTRRRAWHTLLLSACGALFAWFAGTALEILPQQSALCIALFALTAGICAAVLEAAVFR